MKERSNNIIHTKGISKFSTILIISGFVVFLIIYWIVKPRLQTPHEQTPLVACRSNLKMISLAIQMYADDNSGFFPPSEKWCDSINSYLGDDTNIILRCPAIRDDICHYAINPNCEPDSPDNTVLLFETKDGGWNLSGGPELSTNENHKEKVCNVLFNDGTVKSIKKEDILNLNWSGKRKNE